MSFDIRDQIALVTGANRGIGKAIADAMHQAGARVIVSSRTESDLKATGHQYKVCDLADADQISPLVPIPASVRPRCSGCVNWKKKRSA